MKERQDSNILENTLTKQYAKRHKRNFIILAVLLVMVVLFAIGDLLVDDSDMGFVDTIMAFFGLGDPKQVYIVWNLRMRRVVTAIVSGAGLAIAGLIMQTCLKNDLAAPSTIGVSSAATFGANVAIIGLGAGVLTGSNDIVNINNPYLTTLFAFIFSLIGIFLIVLIAKMQKYSTEAIILAGAALSALFGAGTTLLQYFADDISLAGAIFWTFGDLGRTTWTEVIIMSVVLIVCLVYFFTQSWNYNALKSGDESAKSLGVNVKLLRILGLIFASLLTSVIISFIGLIGFIGLIAPQIMKRIIGTDHRFYIPATIFAGSIILCFADTLARVIIPNNSLPVGAITALFGAPIFILVLIKKGRRA